MVGLDPKGNVVLMSWDVKGRIDAFLFRGGGFQPFVYAYGYDPQSGEWSQGRYFSDPTAAYFAANPRIIENTATWWEREDFERALADQGVEPSPANVADLIDEVRGMKGWRDRAIEAGNDEIAEAVQWIPAFGEGAEGK